jgi:GTP-binding protein
VSVSRAGDVAPAARGLPVVALVGRANVGKSTLFNRLVRARRAIVDDAPGVTRDRVVAPARHAGRAFLCVDTGGFEADPPRDPAAMAARVRAQTLAAVGEADCVVCVLDGDTGLTPGDRDTVRLLRRSGKPVLYAVSKLDTPRREAALHEFHAAGAEPLLPVSAAHGRGLEALLDAIVARLPDVPPVADEGTGTRLALIGRPNVGKSSLLNRLVGTERTIVAPEAGTTRDAVDTPLTADGRPYVLIDTAGIRRRARTRETLERHGAVRALGTLVRTDLVLLVLDAGEGFTDQDANLAGRALEAGRGVVLVANKWDTVPPARRETDAFRAALAAAHPAFGDLPLVCVSARTGAGMERLFPTIARIERAYRAELPTPRLNRTLAAAVEAHPPPAVRGRAVRLYYAAQTGTAPPAVTVFTNVPGALPPTYTRYLTGRLAAAFGLLGVPLRLVFRSRPRTELSAPRAPGRSPRGRRSSRPSGGGARSRRR